MNHEPAIACVRCGYPLLSEAANAACPECGNSIQNGQLQRAGLVGKWRTHARIACALTSISLLILFLSSLTAIEYHPFMFYVVPIHYQWLIVGWYIATVPALAAIVFSYRAHQAPSIRTIAVSVCGLFGWSLTCLGLYLEDEHISKFGLTLTATAPAGVFCLLLLLAGLANRLSMQPLKLLLFACVVSAAIGMTLFVGMTMAVYYDYTIGMDFYLGGENSFLVSPTIYLGLSLSVTAGFIGLVAGFYMAGTALRLPRLGSKSLPDHN